MSFTLAVIKPDAIRNKYVGKIIKEMESKGFDILEMKMVYMDKKDTEFFYNMLKNKPYFNNLVDGMKDKNWFLSMILKMQ
jgi:nucleoside diphosphate kinase